jgi:diguanylate cyclase
MAYRLVESAAAALEVLYVNDLLNEYLATDYVTGLTTKKFFLKALDDEVRRALDFQTELACVLIAVDRLDEHVHRYGSGARDRILLDIGKIIRSSTRPYDAVGRVDKNRVGVVLVNQTASEGYLWAEKIRKQIAGHIVPLEDKTLSVTIAAGVCGLSTATLEARDLLTGASQVLEKAAENNGNLVRVYL